MLGRNYGKSARSSWAAELMCETNEHKEQKLEVREQSMKQGEEA